MQDSAPWGPHGDTCHPTALRVLTLSKPDSAFPLNFLWHSKEPGQNI